jgi:hypothetical protein
MATDFLTEIMSHQSQPGTAQPATPLPLESRIFPGLRLNVSALLSGNLSEVLDGLQQGIKTESHAAFVQRLKASDHKKD